MSGRFADRFPCRRTTLAIALGLLAILFAVEAKTAWYGPFGTCGDVQSAKAFPADSPKVLSRPAQTPNPLDSDNLFSMACALIAFSAFAAHDPSRNSALRYIPRVPTTAFLSPLLLFRPPPAL
jgi:hypothetical protein